MYSNHRLDTPPPSSHFTHRPWSPDPHDPLPSLRNQYPQQAPIEDYYHWDAPRNNLQRREATDDSVSVQALDLADYANTLRPWRGGAQQNQAGLEYPPSPIPTRPFSRDSFTNDLPSLSSSVPSAESSTPPYSGHSHDSRRRPFSLPPPSSSYASARFSDPYQAPFVAHPTGSLDRVAEYPGVHDGEVDIAHFPAFSKSWYSKDERSPRSPLSKDHPSAAFFDPTYPTNSLPSHLTNPYSVDTFASAPHPLPWSGTDPYGVPLNAEVKEERMRMLEQEFGAKNLGQSVEEQTLVGSVDVRGKLVTQGPKKRIATRVVEVLMAIGIAGSSFYAALVRRYTWAYGLPWVNSYLCGNPENQTFFDSAAPGKTIYIYPLHPVHPHHSCDVLSFRHSTMLWWSRKEPSTSVYGSGGYDGVARQLSARWREEEKEKEGEEGTAGRRGCASEPDRGSDHVRPWATT